MTSLYYIETVETTLFFSINNKHELIYNSDMTRLINVLVQKGDNTDCTYCFDKGVYICQDIHKIGTVVTSSNGLFLVLALEDPHYGNPQFKLFPADLNDQDIKARYEAFKRFPMCDTCSGEIRWTF